jgi:hypothetical protein
MALLKPIVDHGIDRRERRIVHELNCPDQPNEEPGGASVHDHDRRPQRRVGIYIQRGDQTAMSPLDTRSASRSSSMRSTQMPVSEPIVPAMTRARESGDHHVEEWLY